MAEEVLFNDFNFLLEEARSKDTIESLEEKNQDVEKTDVLKDELKDFKDKPKEEIEDKIHEDLKEQSLDTKKDSSSSINLAFAKLLYDEGIVSELNEQDFKDTPE